MEMVGMKFAVKVTDANWGDTLWEGTVVAADAVAAEVEAIGEYHAYARGAYPVGHYKAEGAIVKDINVNAVRVL